MQVNVVHPVGYVHRPRRSRFDEFGFGTGRTAVTLREVGERPRKVSKVAGAMVYAAEGTAWTVLGQGDGAPRPGDLAAFLEAPGLDAGPLRGPIARWADCSPLLYRDRGGKGRSGYMDPAASKTFAPVGNASADVAAFLDDRVRLWGDRVLVREERVVGVASCDAAHPWLGWCDEPRIEESGKGLIPALVAIRPDRLPALWELRPGHWLRPGFSGPWDEAAAIPAELRRDDDVAWTVNRIASTLALMANPRSYWKNVFESDNPRGRFVAMYPALYDLSLRACTSSIQGEAVMPAMEIVRRAIATYVEAESAVPEGNRGRDWARSLAAFEFKLRLVDREFLPRATPALALDEDADAMDGIGIRP